MSQRNLAWNATRAGQWARQSCPEGSSGQAAWFCDGERLRFWPAHQADLSQCRTNWLAKIANQLDQMLEAPSKHYQSVELARQQNEQLLRVVLGDLALLVRSKELFSEDIKRIDIMMSQVIAQLRSYSALAGWSGQPASSSAAQSGLFADLFSRVAQIVSGLFESGQRGAWLELASQEQRQQLELRLLYHLRDSGALMAAASNGRSAALLPIKLANVLANVIDVRQALDEGHSAKLSFHLQQLWTGAASANRLPLDELEEASLESPSEFKIQAPLLKELMANGK